MSRVVTAATAAAMATAVTAEAAAAMTAAVALKLWRTTLEIRITTRTSP
jgi:hypothetical protein